MTSNGHATNGNGIGVPFHLKGNGGAGNGNAIYANGNNGNGSDSASTLSENGQRGNGNTFYTNGHNGSLKVSASTLVENAKNTSGGLGNGLDVKDNASDVTGNGQADEEEPITEEKGERRLDEYEVDFS